MKKEPINPIEFRFQYKCRRCGKIDSSLCTGNEEIANACLLRVVCGIDYPILPNNIGMNPEMLSTHLCKDGGTGITDLIGYSKNLLKD
jgi:transcription elongation factor Elf1